MEFTRLTASDWPLCQPSRTREADGCFRLRIGKGEARVIQAYRLRCFVDNRRRSCQGTLAHEMIHQWEFDIRKRRPSHGPLFREMMERMNEAGLGDYDSSSIGHETVAICVQ